MLERGKVLRLALLGVLIAGGFIGAHFLDFSIPLIEWRAAILSTGVLAPLVFFLSYVFIVVFLLPASLMTMVGGFIFGPFWGTLLNLTSATIGAACSFLIGRFIARDWVISKTGPKLQVLMDGVEAEGWRFVAFVRLVPLFPYSMLNYFLALTPIRLVPYTVASFIFMAPGAFAYTYVGYLGESFIQSGGKDQVTKIVFGAGLFIGLALIPWFVRRQRKRQS